MSDDLPIVTGELARRISRADARATESRFAGIGGLPGNPLGVSIRRAGSAVALTMRHANPPIPNLILGINAEEQDEAAELVRPLVEMRIPFITNLAPHLASSALLDLLRRLGLTQSDFLTEFYGRPRTDSDSLPFGITVQEFHGNNLGRFAELVVGMDNVPASELALWRRVRQAEFAGWRGYIAFVGQEPAARAAMAVQDGIAILGFATTLPRWRGRGCQMALLRRRIADAAELGSELVVSLASPNKTSERNLQRAGMRVAFTRVEWTPVDVKG
ncbi:MAG: hypothetical protein ACM3JD_12100 [Rudaea sp.]